MEHCMEIKMRPTNYRVMKSKAKHGKAITNAINSIVNDVKKLKERAPKNTRKYILFAFYSMYRESYGIFNKIHLPKISRACGREITSPNRKIHVGEASFYLYLVEL